MNKKALFVLLGQSNAVGHAVPMAEVDKILTPMKNVFGLHRKDNQKLDLEKLTWSGYTSDGIEKLRQEMNRLEELAKEERRKECPGLLNLQTDGNACRFINICRDNGIDTIGDLLKQGRRRILKLNGIGAKSAKLADTALKTLYGIEAW